METFGIMGMSFGMMGFIFAISAMAQISKLEKRVEALEGPPKQSIET